ncbi:hypothetical protein TREES_T100020382 [Tupaia chinensis]|uniref:Uncharacterized protein n=1 Tax=Tupaia chinensis TaxID=246437 RepID=L9L646_TUPCH|nr:hypothetical protein TREES_T100020382 [Tupaia chinensis]
MLLRNGPVRLFDEETDTGLCPPATPIVEQVPATYPMGLDSWAANADLFVSGDLRPPPVKAEPGKVPRRRRRRFPQHGQLVAFPPTGGFPPYLAFHTIKRNCAKAEGNSQLQLIPLSRDAPDLVQLPIPAC